MFTPDGNIPSEPRRHRPGDIVQVTLPSAQFASDHVTAAQALQTHGVSLLLQGMVPAAIAALEQAVELAPMQARYHNNLAEAQRRAGNHEKALVSAQRALQCDPDYPQARLTRAAIRFALGRFDEALADYDRALAHDRNAAAVMAWRGDCLRELGRLRAARHAYTMALEHDPDLLHARANLGPLLLLFGEGEAALSHCERAVALDGASALAWMNLAHCRLRLEQLDAAMLAYAHALERDPSSAEICCCIGEAWQQVGDHEQAAAWFERATQHAPASLRVQACLAALLCDSGHSDAAVRLYRELQALAPDNADISLGLGRSLWEEGDAAGALAQYRHAATLQPQLAQIHCQIADVLLSTGDLSGAEAAQRTALAINPRCANALCGLASSLRAALPASDAATIEHLLTQPLLRDGARSALHAGLGQHYDGSGEHARAAFHANAANRLYWAYRQRRGWSYDPTAHAVQIDRTLATFDATLFARLAGAGDNDARPTFIVGMPRSGTTLTEQILASHPAMLGIGERPFAARSLQQVCQLTGTAHSPLAALAQLDRTGLAQIAADYRRTLDQQLLRHSTPGSIQRIIDKMPDNCELLGWIALLFPRARLIYVRRDPRDIAVSCWMQRFGQIRWACDMGHIAERLRQHHRLMAHWRRVLPIPLFEFDYETLIDDREGTSRRLVEFVGLPWDAQCLDYMRHDGIVRTASVSQVRKPIYTTSVARWRHYASELGPVLAHFPSWPPS